MSSPSPAPPTELPLRSAATWTSKGCDVCGEASELRVMKQRRYELATTKYRAEMLLDDVICESCGFVFAGWIPDIEFLSNFYRDAHSSLSMFRDTQPDFDTTARMATLNEHLNPGCAILEVGANDGTFTETLRRNGFYAVGVDPLDTPQSEFVANAFVADGRKAQATKRRKYDAVLAYYVLEHLTDARAWLVEVRDTLVTDGILVIEVPNFDAYPVESLYPEHLLHFTPMHLSRLLAESGFEVIECGKALPSRYFGFTAVARRFDLTMLPQRPVAIPRLHAKAAVARAQQRWLDALDFITAEEIRMEALAAEIISEHKGLDEAPAIVVWAANAYATRFARAISKLEPDLRVTAVDSAISRIGTIHDGFASPVSGPTFDRAQPGGYLFVICSPSWNVEIRETIYALGLPKVEIIDAITWQP